MMERLLAQLEPEGRDTLETYFFKKDSSIYKHKLVEHKYEDPSFKMEITGKFRDALTRQANEAVRIYARPKVETLNSKSEFNHPHTARVVVERKYK